MKNPRFEHTMNLNCIDLMMTDGTFDIPTLFPETLNPERLLAFHQVKTFRGKKSQNCVHFFIDDYQFERIWNRPGKYQAKGENRSPPDEWKLLVGLPGTLRQFVLTGKLPQMETVTSKEQGIT